MGLDMHAYKVRSEYLADTNQQVDLMFNELPEGVANQAITDGYVVVYDSWW